MPNFEVIAGEVQDLIPITTTSTSTSPPLFTTTTSTTATPDCEMDDASVILTNCTLEGVAVITIPPATTTTTTTQIFCQLFEAVWQGVDGTLTYTNCDGISVGPINITELNNNVQFCAINNDYVVTENILVLTDGGPCNII